MTLSPVFVFFQELFAVSAVILKATLGFVAGPPVRRRFGVEHRRVRRRVADPGDPLALSAPGWQWLFSSSSSAFNWVLNAFGFASVRCSASADSATV